MGRIGRPRQRHADRCRSHTPALSRRSRLAARLAPLVGLAALAFAGTAAAQTLVGNTGQTPAAGGVTVGTSGSAEWEQATLFTTGSNAFGYTLSGVDVFLASVPFGTNPQASIYTVTDAGLPDTKPHALADPASWTENAVNTFTAASGATLLPNTSYAVVLQETRGRAGGYSVGITQSDDEDAGGASGFSIADARAANDAAGSDGWSQVRPTSLRIAVKGSAITGGRELVGNTLQASIGTTITDLAQAFITGDADHAYTLTRVEIPWSTAPSSSDHSVQVFSESSGNPGSSLGTLEHTRNRGTGVYVYTTSGIDLARGTKYFVVMDGKAGLTGSFWRTMSTAEDSGGAPGWGIGDTRHWRTLGSTGAWTNSGHPWQIDLYGHATVHQTGPSLDRAGLAAGNRGKVRLAFNEPLDEDAVPPGRVFSVTVDGSSASLATSDPVAVDGNIVTLTLGSAIATTATAITVAYTAATRSGERPLRDPFGNEANTFHGVKVKTGNRAPVFTATTGNPKDSEINGVPGTLVNLAANRSGFSDPDSDTLTFSASLSRDDTNEQWIDATRPGGSDRFWLEHKGECALANLNPPFSLVSDTTVATLTATDPYGETASLTRRFVVRGFSAGCAAVTGAAVNGATLTLTFESGAPGPAAPSGLSASHFEVRAAGRAVAVSAVSVGTSTTAGTTRTTPVTLTLAESIWAGETATVSHRPGTSPNTQGFLDRAVTVNTTNRRPTATVADRTQLAQNAAPGARGTLGIVFADADIAAAELEIIAPGETPTNAANALTVEVAGPSTFGDGGYDGESGEAYFRIKDVAGLCGLVPVPATGPSGTFETVVTVTATDADGASATTEIVVTTAFDAADCAPALITFGGTAAVVDGTTLTLTFNRPLDESFVPAATDFAVTVAGGRRAVTGVNVKGATVVLTLASTVNEGQAVTVSYTPGATRIRYATGPTVPAVGFADQRVVNLRGETPVFESAAVDGKRLTLTYDQALDEDSEPAVGDYAVTVAGAARSVGGVDVTGATVVLTLASAADEGEAVTVSYTSGTNPLRGTVSANLVAADLSSEAVENVSTAPTLLAGTLHQTTVKLYLSENLNTGGTLSASQFSLTGSPTDLGAVSNPRFEQNQNIPDERNIIVLTVANAASEGDTASLTIADTSGIVDTVGNAAATVTSFAVRNIMGDPPTALPTLTAATVDGNALTLTYDQRLLPRVPPPGDFTVATSVTSPAPTVTGVVVTPGSGPSGSTVVLTLSAPVRYGETVTADYDKSSAPRLQNEWGIQASVFAGEAVTNSTRQAVRRPPPGGTPGGGGRGGGGGGRAPDPDPEPDNEAPERAEALADAMLRVGAELEIDLAAAFSDPDDDALEYAAESSDAGVAAVAVDGDALTVRAVGEGTATITATAEDPDGETATQRFEVTVTRPETVWYLPPMSDPVRQGFVRVVNHSDAAGEATVTATDDAGFAYAPLALALGPRQARHFNSADLELGNAAKGLTGATGPGAGGWRLVVESDDIDVEALAYARTSDGFVTALNAVAPREDGVLQVATFNPGSNVDQVSLLRLVNASEDDAEATVTGVDDAGLSPGAPVLLELPAGSACTVDAAQLESGAGLACGSPQEGLGDGTGKWRLAVASEAPLFAMSLLSSPAGHLTNLSAKAADDGEGVWDVDLFPAASDPYGRQGFVRVTNRSAFDGSVSIRAYDDSDTRYESLRLALDAGETAHFNSDDLELGNRGKGLTGSTGSGVGAWRLRMSSGLRIDVNAYVRTPDGFLTAMQARAPRAGSTHRVAFLNPGSNASQVGVLRLVNRSSREAEATIDGTDDQGVRPGATVRVLVPATDAVELTAAELESGEHRAIASGALGDGAGKWRLRVRSSRLGAVLSLLESPGGHVTNLSGADPERELGDLPAALLPAPATVTLESPARRELRGRWSAVEGARYDVDLLRDGVADEDRSLSNARNTTTSFRWTHLLPGTYAIRARSVNEDRRGGPWRTSEEVVID